MRAVVQKYLDRSDGACLPGGDDPVSGSLMPALALYAEKLAARVLRRDYDDEDEQPEKEQRGGSDTPAGSGRRISELAVIAGRAAAAAYAYKTGDARTLQRLQISLGAELDAEDEFELLRQIVDMTCGFPDSTIEEHERRLVAADVAEWVLSQDCANGHAPAPAEIARYAITVIARIVLATECGDVVSSHPMAETGESVLAEVAALLAERARLYVPTAHEDDLIEGIDIGLLILGGAFAEAS